MQEYGKVRLSDRSQKQYNNITDIAKDVDAILAFAGDHLSPNTMEEFLAWIQSHFPSSSTSIEEASVEQAYGSLVDDIDDILTHRSTVRSFLLTNTSGVFQGPVETCRLAPTARTTTFDLVGTLKGIADHLGSFSGSTDDWQNLADVCGGLVVLGVDRKWVITQKENARRGSVEFPADDESISVGGGRKANLLHLVTCALADGRARLEKVFGKPPLDENRVPDVPQMMRGIGEADRSHQVKLHFIRYILGPEVTIDEGNKKQVEIQFNRARKVITAAFEDDHAPYVASGESWKNLTEMIRKHLQVEDLLLIHPSGEDPESLLRDNVRVLRFLGKIFDAVQAHTGLRVRE
ncbi:MAG TPA: hypothetical protein PLY87_16970 [Planctomycetaceae bacterium]|nr:hypothetical protein [Planctomycetaceae bacterium]HQZ66789.1 hypothetical protein [Planctomycetaceae bacterium]